MKTFALITTLLFTVLLAATLTGCGSDAPLFTSDGRPTQQLQCSGNTAGDCEQRAASQCGSNGYDVLRRDHSGSVTNLLIACHPGS